MQRHMGKATERELRSKLICTTSDYGWPCSKQFCVVLLIGVLANLSTATPTNPVFIQRDLPPAPYAYGMQDFDSSEEVTIVKRTGQTVHPQVTGYLTTPQANPTPLAQVQQLTSAQPLPGPLPLQQQQQKPAKLPKKTPPQPQKPAANSGVASSQVTAGGNSVPQSIKNEPQHSTTSNGSPEHTSLMEVELESAPRPEDMPEHTELDNAIPQHQKRNVYNRYAMETKPGGCGCGGYVLVEKKIYVCEPKETIVRLMKRSHGDVCAAQETQHVGVLQESPEKMFQLIPMPDGAAQ
uniref:Uncharacterized protein n=1 Tax=Anopheles culicifacies TaxID=139723 RepID=A0A182MIA7_9DIPT